MAERTKRAVTYILLIFAGISLSYCANQLPPGGGEVDKIPPEIKEVYPADGTINFTDDYFEVTFSEYVDKRSFKDAIFISPAFEGILEPDWSGKSVRVKFPEPLKQNTTYVVTIGTDLVDYNNKNRMAEAYTLAFSTGNKIDRRVVSGKVYDLKPDGVLIFAYKIPHSDSIITSGSIEPDTTNFLAHKPDYISQTGKDGSFKLGGLAAGLYRIFAVRDEYMDMLYQSEQDRIGMPFKDITLSESDTLFSNLDFFLLKADTLASRLLSAVMTDKYHLLVSVSKDFDSTIIKAGNFYLIDSTANKRDSILYAYKGNTKSTEFVLVINKTLNIQNTIYLFADTLKDMQGNIYREDFTPVTISDRNDTTSVFIIKSMPLANSDKADFQDQKFYFVFNDAFDSATAKTGITFSDTSGNKVIFNINFIDNASFEIEALKKLDPKKDYIIRFNFTKFADVEGNKLDSTYIYRFRTITGLDFTGASGILLNADLSQKPVIILEGTDEEKLTYKQRAGSKGNFNFTRIQPGKYKLWTFLDNDSSGTYSYGWPRPFKPSEEFSFYPDTLNLRARWSQGDIKFKFK